MTGREETAMSENKPATISMFEHENAIMHKEKDCERMKKIVFAVCATFVVITIIFVTAYTIRTRIWLDTFLTILQERPPATEVQNGVYQQPNAGPD